MTALSVGSIQWSFRAIGTTATVVVLDPSLADHAQLLLRTEIEVIDLVRLLRRDGEIFTLGGWPDGGTS
jgi:hypothetical protein